jgi:hypothetical protein
VQNGEIRCGLRLNCFDLVQDKVKRRKRIGENASHLMTFNSIAIENSLYKNNNRRESFVG